MSQLSFARFFDQAKEAAPVTPVKPALPAVNAQTMPHRIMGIEEARRRFISVFGDTARNLRRREVFSDVTVGGWRRICCMRGFFV